MIDELAMAVYNTAHNFKSKIAGIPDGVQGLAQLIGMKIGTFYNQVNYSNEGHAPSLFTVDAMMMHSQDPQILDVLEKRAGRVAYKLPDFSKMGDGSLLESYTAVQKEGGDLAQKLHKALTDGKLSIKEANQIEKEALEQISATLAFVEHVKAIAK